VDAAVRRVRAEGIDALSARAVASVLGCSTAPVFTCFASMEALNEAVLDACVERFVAATEAATGPDPLFAAGFGMVRFAADEPNLYEALFLRRHEKHAKWVPVRRALARRMGENPRYAGLDDRARYGLVGRASVVVHGLAVEVFFGRLPDPSDATLRRLLFELADPLVTASIEGGNTSDIHAPGVNP